MTATALDRPRADTTMTMRVSAQTRDLIDSAAATLGKSRTEFVLESARQHAIDILLDQRVFNLDAQASEGFVRALDNPPLSNDALRALMASKAPWE